MSEHNFGSGNGELTDDAVIEIDAVAGVHGFSIVPYTEPRGEKRYWFAGPNRGSPFDQQAEVSIWSDLEAAGWAKNKSLLPKCFVESDDVHHR